MRRDRFRSGRSRVQFSKSTRPAALNRLSRPIPAPPLIAKAHATLFGDRNRVLELDEAALRMRHRGLDGEDHVGLQRPARVIALISPRLVVGQAWRFMTDEAHAMRHKIQIYPVGRGIHKLMGRRENLNPGSAAADRLARPLLDLLDHTKKVYKLGIWLTQNPHPAQIADIALVISPGIEGKDVAGFE